MMRLAIEAAFLARAVTHGRLSALAAMERDAPCRAAARAWHMLGCYRMAVRGFERAGGAPSPHHAAALAACGRLDEAAVVAAAVMGSRPGRRVRARTGRLLAPFAPALASATLTDAGPAELRAALAAACGDCAAASRLLDRRQLSRDGWLVAANCGLVHPIAALNQALESDGLVLLDSNSAPRPTGLRPAAEPSGVDGPLVSVVVAVHNTADRVEAAIGSLLAQSWRTIEVLAVDDASQDASWDILRRLAARDPRVRTFRQEKNAGPYVARALALRHARGAFVTCHDSDDWAHPERIARQARPLLTDPRLVATTSSWVRMTDEGRFHARQSFPLIRLNPASPMVRREIFASATGGWDQVRAGADSEFLERLKVTFGRHAVRRIDALLGVGAHRAGSLMTDPEIGAAGGALSISRLEYWESWRRWHVAELAAGRLPCMPDDGSRPFPAPPELLR